MSSKKQKAIANKNETLNPSASSFNKPIVWLVAIIILTYIAFSPSLKDGFTNWDDNVYVAENPLINSVSAVNIKKIFSTESIVSNNYHPLTILSLAIDYKLSAYNPKTFHFTNLLFHLFNTALVFWFIYLLSERKVMVAGIVAFFFGVHPLHVESVTWISERKDVLYTFFFMASLIVYYKYIQENAKQKWLLYVTILLMFVLSVLSKAMAVVLPLVFLLVDYYTKRKFNKLVWFEKVPFLALAVVFGLLATKVQQGAIANIETFTLFQRFAFASYGFVMYICKLFVPVNLSCFYPYPNLINDHLPIQFYILPFVALLIMVGVFYSLRKTKIIGFGVLFYSITIVLVLQFISVGQVIMADRYAYVPYIGLVFPIAMGFDWLQSQTSEKFKLYKMLASIAVLIAAIASLYLTYERTNVWKNSDTLWTDAISKYPVSEPFRNRGSYLVNKVAYDKGEKKVADNEYDRALEDFNISIKMNSKNAKVFINRANIYGLKQQFDKALQDYSSAIALDNKDAQTFFNRGITYSIMKRFDEAEKDYSTALLLQPSLTVAKENRAYVNADNGKFDKAIDDLNELITANNTNAIYYFYRGFAYFKMGRNQEAIIDNTRAIELNPAYAAAYFNRFVINKTLGKLAEAFADALKAQSLGYAVDVAYLNGLKRN